MVREIEVEYRKREVNRVRERDRIQKERSEEGEREIEYRKRPVKRVRER